VEGAEVAKRLMMSQAGVACAVKRGESIVKEKSIQMTG